MAADLYGAIDQAIAKINRSKEWSGLPVTLNRQDGSLYLRGIFPSKDGKGQPKRTRYPLGFKAVIPMLAHAEQKGRKIGLRLALGEFRWEDERSLDAIAVIASIHQPLTIAEWISHKELEYWQARAKTPDALENWRTDYGRIYDKLQIDFKGEPISINILKAEIIRHSKPDTRTRKRWVNACGTLADLAGIDKSPLLKIKGTYSAYSPVDVRDIPTATEVIAAYDHLYDRDPVVARWLGMFAIGGFRPSELEKLDLDRFGERNHPVWVMKTKTKQDRVTYCYPRQWYELFELDKFTPPCFGDKTARSRAARIAEKFKDFGLDRRFYPYNLRHRKAIELMVEAKLPTDVIVKMLGHKPEIFNRVYLNWMNDSHYNKLFDDLADNQPKA